MFRNHLFIAWRALIRNKLYSFINVLGLAIGVSACLVIFLIVNYELSFDHFHRDSDRIFRVYSQFSGDYSGFNRGVPAPVSINIKQEVKGIEYASPLHTWFANVEVIEGGSEPRKFEGEKHIAIVAPEYFEIFPDFRWIAGNPQTALGKPFQVALMKSKAKIYFGTDDPAKVLGRVLHYQDSLVLTVSGMLEDPTEHTDFSFTDFISYSTVGESWLKKRINPDTWSNTNSSSNLLVKLTPGTSIPEVETGVDTLVSRHRKKDADANWIVHYHLQPLNDVHFNNDLGIFDNIGESAHLPTLQMLVIVALMLLVIAAINFINLETAQAVRRAREVGLRKVMGSSRARIIFHFLLQSALLTLFAVVLALPLSELAIYFFDGFIPAGVQLHITDPFTITFLGLSVVVVSFLAGFYPAFSLSSFLPAVALKNQISANSHQTRSGLIRRSLIVFQFTFAQTLIVATLIVGWQIHFMLNKDLGFTKEAIIYINTPWRMPHSKAVTLKNELANLPEIQALTLCQDVPASSSWSSNTMNYNNGKEELHHNVYRKFGDTAFLSVFDLHLLAGRNIHRSDSAEEVIINETYTKMLGFQKPEDAVDKVLNEDKHPKSIVGVVKDFNMKSLHTAVEPVIIADEEYNFSTIAMKVQKGMSADEMKQFTNKLTDTWKKIYADEKFEYHFFDESIARFYTKEERTAKLVGTATLVAILISCMGLFGLATYTAAQRTKEIGIRKVMGASVGNIVGLLSKDFLWLVIIAFVISTPLAYYGSGTWLSSYAYRISVGWQIFAVTMVSSLLITLISVSYQARKAAKADPVDSLRHE